MLALMTATKHPLCHDGYVGMVVPRKPVHGPPVIITSIDDGAWCIGLGVPEKWWHHNNPSGNLSSLMAKYWMIDMFACKEATCCRICRTVNNVHLEDDDGYKV